MRTIRLRVTLREVCPRVVRVIDVPASSTLPELHGLVQVALGWTDSHLHQFVADDVCYGVPDEEWPDHQVDEAAVRLRDLPERFVYLYDFGDGWTHDVELLGPGRDQPGCVYGEGTCPPEDCGGPSGYAELRAVLADPEHDDYEQMRDWTGDLEQCLKPVDDQGGVVPSRSS
jgi:Plasmid pRiA4b ORF-3-like protein